ncbi:hypothetical protein HUG10_20985 (plasmid) [Halorarum halophilum]|uniref:Uncharacterized protein n=1 Tax=Halorarum halophilum TaxID=2743090 RepID=A0A7D5L337_9EURY|nr:hypothetical protein [Halobaculum halophilum]QLG30063.1 hypothetical protein HUG10_20985 [Halobaculum halophilum]
MNPTTRTEREGVPIDIYDEPERVTASTGSYTHGQPGVHLALALDYVGEVPDEVVHEEVATIVDELLERGRAEIERQEEQ